ncbi:MAG TPA: DUF3853 family protein [Dysgonamonadaceae bacterium]|jgi:hypothetical protein|nr:DUF3853 family protein [Dysgonamonadaceae bacterium]
METISENTPVVMLTVKQLREALKMTDEVRISDDEKPKHYVYGIAGIRQLFGVSHVTAIRYKNTIIKDAVSQQGRIIVTDVDKAMELFKKAKK